MITCCTLCTVLMDNTISIGHDHIGTTAQRRFIDISKKAEPNVRYMTILPDLHSVLSSSDLILESRSHCKEGCLRLLEILL